MMGVPYWGLNRPNRKAVEMGGLFGATQKPMFSLYGYILPCRCVIVHSVIENNNVS